ncbi:MAG: hypothetical protein QOI52_1874, partial [Chloroflexota bacterium]|nr:hypothetical protein [Chloroflexota bacterium]
MRRVGILAAAVTILAAGPIQANPQDYPSRPI